MNTSSDPSPLITQLHAAFCASTGIQLRLGIGEYSREAAWFRFSKAGFTTSDIQTVVRYLQRKIKDGSRNAGALKFSNLIERLEMFEEDLAMARAEARNAKPAMTPKERAVEQLRPTSADVRPEDCRITARSVGDLISDLKRAAGMT